MPDLSIEEAVERSCQALMSGDLMQVMSDFTPEALGAVMASASAITNVPSLVGYSVRSQQEDGGDHVFDVAFQTSEGEVAARVTWREIDDTWKIIALSVDGLGPTGSGP